MIYRVLSSFFLYKKSFHLEKCLLIFQAIRTRCPSLNDEMPMTISFLPDLIFCFPRLEMGRFSVGYYDFNEGNRHEGVEMHIYSRVDGINMQ